MLEDRKAAILRAVVQEYISTAQPVGSSAVASAPGIDVSSATVRNEMLHLERQGYLHQPHTSSGRIPTEKGYRFFVDALAPEGTLGDNQRGQVREFFDHTHGELERMLQETSGLLSDLTSYASVVVAPAPRTTFIRSIALVRVGHRHALAVVVLSNGSVEKTTIELDDEHVDDDIDRASAALAVMFVGQQLTHRPALPAGVPPAAAGLVSAVELSLDRLIEPEADHVYVGGTARVARAFDAVETVSRVLSILEQQLVVVSLLRDVLSRGLSVAIGSETGVQPLAECSLVVAPYVVEGESAGTIGVLGPTRMNYPQALSAVAVVSKALSDRLSEG